MTVWAAASLSSGCGGHAVQSETAHTITPGVGIRGRLEMGMSLGDVKRHFRGVECELDREDRVVRVTIRALGFLGMYSEENGRFTQMFFLVRRVPGDDADPSAKMGRFTGDLDGGISFFKGDVRREDVIATFGEPVQIVARAGDTDEAFREYHAAMGKAWHDGRPFECSTSGGTSILYYPRDGIAFVIERSNIEEIRVFSPDNSSSDTNRLVSPAIIVTNQGQPLK